MDKRSAIRAIEREGCLLVYPINNAPQPHSLWKEFFPRKKMEWEWDDESDNRVADLWHLREELSRSGRVVYAKWYRGRATFFSRTFFVSLLGTLRRFHGNLSPEAREIWNALLESSPQSTKELRRTVDLEGKFHARTYEKALKELWQRLLIVGFGEVDDGAFPSLAMGAASHLFEKEWKEAMEIDEAVLRAGVDKAIKRSAAFERFFLFLEKSLERQQREPSVLASS